MTNVEEARDQEKGVNAKVQRKSQKTVPARKKPVQTLVKTAKTRWRWAPGGKKNKCAPEMAAIATPSRDLHYRVLSTSVCGEETKRARVAPRVQTGEVGHGGGPNNGFVPGSLPRTRGKWWGTEPNLSAVVSKATQSGDLKTSKN